MARNSLNPNLVAVILLLAIPACSPGRTPYVPPSATNGGPEDPVILAIEKLGGSCFRADSFRGSSWFKEIEGDPVVGVQSDRCADPSALFAQLRRLPHLQKLEIRYTPLDDGVAQGFAALKGLRSLRIGEAQLSASGLRAVAHLEHLQDLRMEDHLGDEGLEALKSLRELRELTVSGSQITDAGARHVATLIHLERLCLGGTAMSDAGIGELRSLRNLVELRLRMTKFNSSGLEHLGEIPNLRILDLYGSTVASTDLGHLTKLAQLKDLQLGSAVGVTDAGLDDLSKLPQLTNLDLSSTKITDAGMKSLAHCRRLEHLNVCDTAITNDGLRELFPIKSLGSIYVINTRVTDRGLQRFEREHGHCLGMIDR